MKINLSKQLVFFTSLSIFLTGVFIASIVYAQEPVGGQPPEACQHDPFPSDAPNIDVSCDDPSCNYGPCANSQASECWNNPTLETPQSRAQNTRVPCNDTSCNEGPCTNALIKNEEKVKEKETKMKELTEQKEEHRAAIQERAQDRIVNLASNVVMRLTSAIDRFGQIISRLDSRIEKLKNLEVDTSSAVAKLDEVKDSLSEAKNTITDLSSVREAVSGGSPRETFGIVRTELKTVRDLLKQTHSQLREVVSLLKDAVRQAELSHGVSDVVSNRENVAKDENDTDAE